LDRQGTPYTVIDLSADPHALDMVKALGHRQAPVVVTEADHWSGFRPDKIAGLASLADQRVAA
jgi:glutaredoxin-like protein NrdH